MLATLQKLYSPLNFSLFKEFLKRLHKLCSRNSFSKTFPKHLPVLFKTCFHTSFQSKHVLLTKAEVKVLKQI